MWLEAIVLMAPIVRWWVKIVFFSKSSFSGKGVVACRNLSEVNLR